MATFLSNRTPLSVGRSYAWCERLARRAAANFYHAFRLLPAEQRRALCALYAFLRLTDDLADSAASTDERRADLRSWRHQFHMALDGDYQHPVHPALHDTVRRYRVPTRFLEAVLDGVEMDLDTVRYDTFADLYPYCWRVASAVGLCCIHIWGFRGEGTESYAEAAGIAFQLTNILRDLGEDAARGRIYLPTEDLERFGYSAADLSAGRSDERFRALMRFETIRARSFYDAATPLVERLHPAGRAVFLVMLRTYRGLLDEIERRDYDVFRERVRLSRLHKLWLAARALPARWDWF